MNLINKLDKIRLKIKNTVDRVVEIIALHFIYLLGIGITNLFSRIQSKDFLSKQHFFTSWKKYSAGKNVRKMY